MCDTEFLDSFAVPTVMDRNTANPIENTFNWDQMEGDLDSQRDNDEENTE